VFYIKSVFEPQSSDFFSLLAANAIYSELYADPKDGSLPATFQVKKLSLQVLKMQKNSLI
jgi:hypothetical protein